MSRNREIFLVFVVAVVGTACATSLARTWGLKSSDVAAWVQAVGSVAAILCAVALTNRQINAVREGRIREKQYLAHGIADAVQLAVHSFIRFGPEIKSRHKIALRKSYVERDYVLRKTLDAFIEHGVADWPSALLYARSLAVQAAQDNLWNSLTYYMTQSGDVDWPHLVAELHVYEKAVADFTHAYGALRFD